MVDIAFNPSDVLLKAPRFRRSEHVEVPLQNGKKQSVWLVGKGRDLFQRTMQGARPVPSDQIYKAYDSLILGLRKILPKIVK